MYPEHAPRRTPRAVPECHWLRDAVLSPLSTEDKTFRAFGDTGREEKIVRIDPLNAVQVAYHETSVTSAFLQRLGIKMSEHAFPNLWHTTYFIPVLANASHCVSFAAVGEISILQLAIDLWEPHTLIQALANHSLGAILC
jgi:hypothetical protein